VAVDDAKNQSAPSAELSATTYPDDTPPTAPQFLYLSFYYKQDELLQTAARHVMYVRMGKSVEDPDSAILCYQLALEDVTAGTPPEYKWSFPSPWAKILTTGIDFIPGHTYRFHARSLNTSYGVSPVTTSSVFEYAGDHIYPVDENEFLDDSALVDNIWRKYLPFAGQSIEYDAALDAIVLYPGSSAYPCDLYKYMLPAPEFSFVTVLKTISAYDSDTFFEVKLTGSQGYYLLRCYYGYPTESDYIAKVVNGQQVGIQYFDANIQQGQEYVFTFQQSLAVNQYGHEISRMVLNFAGQDLVIDDYRGPIEVYEARIKARQQVLALDYYFWLGNSVDLGAFDTTPPSQPVVTNTDGAYFNYINRSTNTAELDSTWISSDYQSAVVAYQYAVGTYPTGNNVVNWTATTDPFIHITIPVMDGVNYYVSVKAQNEAGLWSEVGTSPKITADYYATGPFFDAFDTNTLSLYHVNTSHFTWQSSAKDVLIQYQQYGGSTDMWYELDDFNDSVVDGGFRFKIKCRTSPPNYLYAPPDFILCLRDASTFYYNAIKLKFQNNFVTAEVYYHNSLVYSSGPVMTPDISINDWDTLILTFDPNHLYFNGLGATISKTFYGSYLPQVNRFSYTFYNWADMELDNIGLAEF